MVCMHCDDPDLREVCPADAIKKSEDGVVQSSLKPRCIACSNCVLACPFGIPKMMIELEQMMKCDMCYDRTSVGKRPMCATVCPSQALAYVPPERIARERREKPTNVFQFGNQTVTTKVFMMVPPQVTRRDRGGRRRLHVGDRGMGLRAGGDDRGTRGMSLSRREVRGEAGAAGGEAGAAGPAAGPSPSGARSSRSTAPRSATSPGASSRSSWS